MHVLHGHFKIGGNAIGLKLSPCGTATVDWMHWPLMSPILTDRLVPVSIGCGPTGIHLYQHHMVPEETPGSFLLRVCQRPKIDLGTRSGIPCLLAWPSNKSVSLQR